MPEFQACIDKCQIDCSEKGDRFVQRTEKGQVVKYKGSNVMVHMPLTVAVTVVEGMGAASSAKFEPDETLVLLPEPNILKVLKVNNAELHHYKKEEMQNARETFIQQNSRMDRSGNVIGAKEIQIGDTGLNENMDFYYATKNTKHIRKLKFMDSKLYIFQDAQTDEIHFVHRKDVTISGLLITEVGQDLCAHDKSCGRLCYVNCPNVRAVNKETGETTNWCTVKNLEWKESNIAAAAGKVLHLHLTDNGTQRLFTWPAMHCEVSEKVHTFLDSIVNLHGEGDEQTEKVQLYMDTGSIFVLAWEWTMIFIALVSIKAFATVAAKFIWTASSAIPTITGWASSIVATTVQTVRNKKNADADATVETMSGSVESMGDDVASVTGDGQIVFDATTEAESVSAVGEAVITDNIAMANLSESANIVSGQTNVGTLEKYSAYFSPSWVQRAREKFAKANEDFQRARQKGNQRVDDVAQVLGLKGDWGVAAVKEAGVKLGNLYKKSVAERKELAEKPEKAAEILGNIAADQVEAGWNAAARAASYDLMSQIRNLGMVGTGKLFDSYGGPFKRVYQQWAKGRMSCAHRLIYRCAKVWDDDSYVLQARRQELAGIAWTSMVLRMSRVNDAMNSVYAKIHNNEYRYDVQFAARVLYRPEFGHVDEKQVLEIIAIEQGGVVIAPTEEVRLDYRSTSLDLFHPDPSQQTVLVVKDANGQTRRQYASNPYDQNAQSFQTFKIGEAFFKAFHVSSVSLCNAMTDQIVVHLPYNKMTMRTLLSTNVSRLAAKSILDHGESTSTYYTLTHLEGPEAAQKFQQKHNLQFENGRTIDQLTNLCCKQPTEEQLDCLDEKCVVEYTNAKGKKVRRHIMQAFWFTNSEDSWNNGATAPLPRVSGNRWIKIAVDQLPSQMIPSATGTVPCGTVYGRCSFSWGDNVIFAKNQTLNWERNMCVGAKDAKYCYIPEDPFYQIGVNLYLSVSNIQQRTGKLYVYEQDGFKEQTQSTPKDIVGYRHRHYAQRAFLSGNWFRYQMLGKCIHCGQPAQDHTHLYEVQGHQAPTKQAGKRHRSRSEAQLVALDDLYRGVPVALRPKYWMGTFSHAACMDWAREAHSQKLLKYKDPDDFCRVDKFYVMASTLSASAIGFLFTSATGKAALDAVSVSIAAFGNAAETFITDSIPLMGGLYGAAESVVRHAITELVRIVVDASSSTMEFLGNQFRYLDVIRNHYFMPPLALAGLSTIDWFRSAFENANITVTHAKFTYGTLQNAAATPTLLGGSRFAIRFLILMIQISLKIVRKTITAMRIGTVNSIRFVTAALDVFPNHMNATVLAHVLRRAVGSDTIRLDKEDAAMMAEYLKRDRSAAMDKQEPVSTVRTTVDSELQTVRNDESIKPYETDYLKTGTGTDASADSTNVDYYAYRDSVNKLDYFFYPKLGNASVTRYRVVDGKAVKPGYKLQIDDALRAKAWKGYKNGKLVENGFPTGLAEAIDVDFYAYRDKLNGFAYYHYPDMVNPIVTRYKLVNGKPVQPGHEVEIDETLRAKAWKGYKNGKLVRKGFRLP